MRKICTCSVKSSSILFYCSIHAMYDRLNCSKKQRIMLKSYIPGNNSLIYPKIHYENFVSVKIVNALHD